jgi:photosystem II stability/assembly factor-like uncharacterized protein
MNQHAVRKGGNMASRRVCLLAPGLLAALLATGLVVDTASVGALSGPALGPGQATSSALSQDLRIAGFEKHQAMKRSSPFRDLEWSYLGPTNHGGGAVDVAVADRGASRRIYVTYRAGGVAKSDDNGDTWQPVLAEAAEPFATAIAVAPSNPDVVWVGTSAGVYMSTDAARTWTYVGLSSEQGCPAALWPDRCFGRIVIHPTNPDIVYIAAAGPSFHDGGVRGVFKTTNGGGTWVNVLFRNALTGASDLVMDPANPETLYAAVWQLTHHQGGFFYRGVDRDANQTSIWRTTNGGATWTEIATGLPQPRHRGRIGIDIARSNPSVLYAFINNYEPREPAPRLTGDVATQPAPQESFEGAELYRTADRGATWVKVSKPDMMRNVNVSYTDQFGQVRVDPKDDNTVYLLSVRLGVSRNGGREFSEVTGPHVDHQGLWIDPKRDVLYNTNDGGIYLSDDAGATWKFTPAPSTLIYNVALDMATPFHAYGSVQDSRTSYRVIVDTARGRTRLQAMEFEVAPGWERTHHAIDPTNPSIVYAATSTAFNRYDLSLSPARTNAITPRVADGEPPLRQRSLTPFVLSAHDPSTLYRGHQYVYRSQDRGDHWDRISPDLTDNSEDARQRAPFPAQAITALSESPRMRGLIYAGTDDGRVHVTKDGGKTWTEITSRLPFRKPVIDVLASASAPGTVYVVVGLPYRQPVIANDFGAWVFRSTDYGQTFTSVSANLSIGPAIVIREDPREPTTLYVGTRLGVYVSTDAGGKWEVLGGNMPTVFVTDLQVHPRDHIIVAATWGAGMWAMDARTIARR